MFWKTIRLKTAIVFTLVAALLFYFGYSVTAQKGDPTEELYYPTEDDFAKIETIADEKNYGDIEKGQTENQNDVKAILGPPHRIGTWESRRGEIHRPHEPGEKVFHYKAAPNEDVESYHVKFNADGHIIGWNRDLKDKRSLIDKMKAWLKYGF